MWGSKIWRSKKFIVIVLLAVLVVAGSIGGVALAQSDNENDSQPEAVFGVLWDKVGAIYEQKTGVAIDQEALEDSFAQAQNEMRDEALQNRLQSLVKEGKMTQEQADQYKEWLESKPEGPIMPGFGNFGGGRCGGPHDGVGFGSPSTQ